MSTIDGQIMGEINTSKKYSYTKHGDTFRWKARCSLCKKLVKKYNDKKTNGVTRKK